MYTRCNSIKKTGDKFILFLCDVCVECDLTVFVIVSTMVFTVQSIMFFTLHLSRLNRNCQPLSKICQQLSRNVCNVCMCACTCAYVKTYVGMYILYMYILCNIDGSQAEEMCCHKISSSFNPFPLTWIRKSNTIFE